MSHMSELDADLRGTNQRPHTSVYVALLAPNAPYSDPDVHVSWSATRFSSGHEDVTVHVHVHGNVIRIADSTSLTALPEVPAWVPQPPANWLASLELQRDLIAEASAAIDADASLRAYLAREGRL